MNLTYVVPSIGRDSLKRTLTSLRWQKWGAGDEVVLLADAAAERVRRMWLESGVRGRCLDVPAEYRGLNVNRNFGLRHARGDYVCYLDDDDVLLPHAFETVRAACVDNPGAVHLFRFLMPKSCQVFWHTEGEFGYGNLGTPCISHPNRVGAYGVWPAERGGDGRFIAATCECVGRVLWHREVIAAAYPSGDTLA